MSDKNQYNKIENCHFTIRQTLFYSIRNFIIILILSYLVNLLFFVIAFIAGIISNIHIYYRFFEIQIDDKEIVFRYKFINKEIRFNWNEIKEFHYYESFMNKYDMSSRFKIILNSQKKTVYIKLISIKDTDLKKLETCIKHKGIKTRFVYYSLFDENEILPQDVGYDD